ncbi:MAG: HEAT repeat domain-containing protein [Pirellulaceae bacterium]
MPISNLPPRANKFAIAGLCVYFLLSFARPSVAQEAQWIWSPEHPRAQAKAGDCFFRKTIQVSTVEQAMVTITADDRYELFVNGRQVGSGKSIRQMEQYDISALLSRGRNVIAIRVTNLADGPAALAARVFIKPTGGPWVSHSTSSSWRTALDTAIGWQSVAHDDSRWKPAQAFGLLGETAPWDRREDVSPERVSENQRFQINPEFFVDEILDGEATGSLVNMAFNEFGHIIAAQEGGPLLLIYDSNKDGVPDKTRDYCDLVDNIQGILPLNGDVFVTGDGPDGSGIYRLIDNDRNGSLEKAQKIAGFTGDGGEHGGHGLALGPDGRIYCVLGNHVQFDGEFADSSPLKNVYEGDLIGPRYEDPGGHARGIKAPGGTVIRMDVEGKSVELVAGGLRNAFDLVFHPSGRLFVHDSDMESDEGAVWYRPTSLYEIGEAGEYGWRSGWAKWPDYFFDRLPTLLETGRGSPTGACVYEHHMFPQRYHGCLFLADWTQGQILAVKLEENGTAQSHVFLQGQPLNVTDLTVGPDGHLYFCTGGRGTKGGIYQVRWQGDVPDAIKNLGSGIAKAIKQPQLDAAWARQSIASLKRELGASWGDTVAGVAFSDENPAKYRLRALDLMQLFGPTPTPELLTELSKAPNESVRARAARLMGMHTDSSEVAEKLTELLNDSDPTVQLAASEAFIRCGKEPEVSALIPLLASSNRNLAWSARRLLERIPQEQWRDELLSNDRQRVQLQAGLALMITDPSTENALDVLAMAQKMLKGFVSDRNFADLLRLCQVALHRSGVNAAEVPELKEMLANEFPVGEPALNRELFRLLAYLNADSVVPPAITYLQSDAPLAERMHIAMHLRFFKHTWTAAERYAVVKFFEETQPVESGSSVPLYVMNVTRDLCRDLPLEEARIFVSEGAKWPNAALVSLFRYPDKLSSADLQTLRSLDQEIDRPGFEAEHYKRLRTGIVAMLAQNGDAESTEYLREIWVRSPERRQAVALGLAQQPNDENWDYLVRSLPVLESFAVSEVLDTLRQIPNATDDAQALREVILHGLRMEANAQAPDSALKLLEYWTGESHSAEAESASLMSGWQAWYADKFPALPEAKLPELEQSSPWSLDTLDEFFATSDGRKGSSEHGRQVFERAQCANCHRVGNLGKSVGPDLTSAANRFTRKELLESTLYPSHIISDQYRTQRVLTTSGKVYTGVVLENSDGTRVVRDSNLDEHIIAEQDIEQIQPSKISLMPSGLLDTLTAADIRDMMTFLGFVPEQQVATGRSVPNLK